MEDLPFIPSLQRRGKRGGYILITFLVSMAVTMYRYLETIAHTKKNVEIQFLVFPTQRLKYGHWDGQRCL